MTEKPPARQPSEGVTFHKVEKEGPLNREDVTALLKERTTAGPENAPSVTTAEGDHADTSEREETEEEKKARELNERLAEQKKEVAAKAAEAAKKPAQAKTAHAAGHGGHHSTFGTGPIAVFFMSLWKIGAYFVKEMGSTGGGHGGGGGHAAPKKKEDHGHGGGGHGH